MLPEGLRTNLTWLGVTVLLILAIGAFHNYTVPERDGFEFGMCTIDYVCEGYETGDTCLGIEQKKVTCIDPATAAPHQRAEAECALDAQSICNANPELTGTEWTNNEIASYEGTSCSDWAADDERVELLTCEQTFDDISQWQ